MDVATMAPSVAEAAPSVTERVDEVRVPVAPSVATEVGDST
jgi:hypothetical protein